MPAKSTLADEMSKEVFFFFLFMIIIFSWVLIDLWCKWLNNFTYVTLGLDENNTLHTFVIAMVVTCIILSCITFARSFGVDYRVGIIGDSDIDGVFADNKVDTNTDITAYEIGLSNLWRYTDNYSSDKRKVAPISELDMISMHTIL